MFAFRILGMFNQTKSFGVMHDERQRHEGRQRFRQHHRPRARAAAAMRRRKSFVQIDMHRIDAEIGRPHASDDGVEIGAIAIEIGAGFMHVLGDGNNIALEQAAGVGIGQHDGGDIGPQFGLQSGTIHAAIGIRREWLRS